MLQMVYEDIAGAGLRSPPILVAATLLRDLQTTAIPAAFLPVAVVLGLMGHMMYSVILGAVFGAFVAPRIANRGTLAAAATIYGLAVFVLMRLVVVPVVDPALAILSWPAFAVAHLMWGATIGLVLGWQPRRAAELVHAHA